MHVVIHWKGPGYYVSQDNYNRTQFDRHFYKVSELEEPLKASRIAWDWGSQHWAARQLSDLITSAEVIDETRKEAHV